MVTWPLTKPGAITASRSPKHRQIRMPTGLARQNRPTDSITPSPKLDCAVCNDERLAVAVDALDDVPPAHQAGRRSGSIDVMASIYLIGHVSPVDEDFPWEPHKAGLGADSAHVPRRPGLMGAFPINSSVTMLLNILPECLARPSGCCALRQGPNEPAIGRSCRDERSWDALHPQSNPLQSTQRALALLSRGLGFVLVGAAAVLLVAMSGILFLPGDLSLCAAAPAPME